MAQVINIEDALCGRAKPGFFSSRAISTKLRSAAASASDQPSVTKENVYRAILLLDIAAQRMRLLLRNIADPSRKSVFEAQVTAIEQSIQHARDLALKL